MWSYLGYFRTSWKPHICISKTPEQSVSKSKTAADFLEQLAAPDFFSWQLGWDLWQKGHWALCSRACPFLRTGADLRKFQESQVSMVVVAAGARSHKEGSSFQLESVLPKNYRLVTICSGSATQLYAVGLPGILSKPMGRVLVSMFLWY